MAHEIQLKYGCNPNQKPSRIFMEGGELPLEVVNSRPGYINFLDALNSWQLVTELKKATGMPCGRSASEDGRVIAQAPPHGGGYFG